MFCNHQNTLKTGDCNLGPTSFANRSFGSRERSYYNFADST